MPLCSSYCDAGLLEVQLASAEAGRRVSRVSFAARVSLTDFLQRRSVTDARGSLFQTLNRRPSRTGAFLVSGISHLIYFVSNVERWLS